MTTKKASALEILERLLSAYGVNSQRGLAQKLGIPANNISGWTQRNSVPGDAIISCALDTGADLRWLTTGELEKPNAVELSPKQPKGKVLYDQILSSGGKTVLRRILDAYGFDTQKELGELLNISSATISTWVRREYFPGDVVIACCLDTGVSLGWLATGKGSQKSDDDSLMPLDTSVRNIAKKTLRAGLLEDAGEWRADPGFLPPGLIEPIYVVSQLGIWLVDYGITSISNGRWLLDIDGKHDVYDVTLLPGKKMSVKNSSSTFECGIEEVRAVGRVSLTVEYNY